MSAELDEVAKSLYNGFIPSIWRALAPATLKSLGNWMVHFLKRNEQYCKWVSIFISVLSTERCYEAENCTFLQLLRFVLY